MNKIIFIILFLFLQFFAWSQDTIQLRNGTLISAKVLEVNSESVKFKRSEILNGPDYIESKSNIYSIRYNNGYVDSVIVKEWAYQPSVNNAPDLGKIKITINGYYYVDPMRNGVSRRIGEREILIISKNKAKEIKSRDLIRLIRKTRFGTQKSRFSMVFGITTITLCGMICVTSLMEYPNAYKTQAQVDETKKLGLVTGISGLTIGLGFETLAVFQHRKKKKKLLETVTLYNSLLK